MSLIDARGGGGRGGDRGGLVGWRSLTLAPLPPGQVIRDTVVAAANMDYPKDKLTICICDDGKNREEVRALVDQVREECKARGNYVTIRYFRRHKEVGGWVSVHACASLSGGIMALALYAWGRGGVAWRGMERLID